MSTNSRVFRECDYEKDASERTIRKKKAWFPEEDQRLKFLIEELGPLRWTLIAKRLTNRTGKQCRERWFNHLNPEVNMKSWKEEEEWILYLAQALLGNQWTKISKYLDLRSDNNIKNHWNSIMLKKKTKFYKLMWQAIHLKCQVPGDYKTKYNAKERLLIDGIIEKLNKTSNSTILENVSDERPTKIGSHLNNLCLDLVDNSGCLSRILSLVRSQIAESPELKIIEDFIDANYTNIVNWKDETKLSHQSDKMPTDVGVQSSDSKPDYSVVGHHFNHYFYLDFNYGIYHHNLVHQSIANYPQLQPVQVITYSLFPVTNWTSMMGGQVNNGLPNQLNPVSLNNNELYSELN